MLSRCHDVPVQLNKISKLVVKLIKVIKKKEIKSRQLIHISTIDNKGGAVWPTVVPTSLWSL